MWRLFNQAPQHIAQLGLGTAALTKFCYRQFPGAQVTAIELNPDVIAIAIAIAFKRSPQIDFSILYERAAAIRRKTGMPAKTWVTGLKAWMLEQ